jgi:hypothetical protein
MLKMDEDAGLPSSDATMDTHAHATPDGADADTVAGPDVMVLLEGAEGAAIVRAVPRLAQRIIITRSSTSSRGVQGAVARVVGDKDLMSEVVSFVGGETGRQSVRVLGQVALVCRQWREVAVWEGRWVGIEEEVVGGLWREEEKGGRRAVGRARLMAYGRMLLEERRVWRGDDWQEGLELHFEVFDRMDGLQMVSVRGALSFSAHEQQGCIGLSVLPSSRMKVVGSSFSAASRDPQQRRFASIAEYFTRGHGAEYACQLYLRVTVRDVRRGRSALLLEEGKRTVRQFKYPSPSMQARLAEGSKTVISDVGKLVMGHGTATLECRTSMFISPEPNQEGVGEQKRLYRLAPDILVVFESADASKLGSLIRSLC